MAEENAKRHTCRWWKVGFVVALIGFELAREVAVLAGGQEAEFAGSPLVMVFGTDARAQGTWVRNDGGEKLVPTGVSIQCDRDKGSCISATVNAHGTSFFAPDISVFPATFTDEVITYVDDFPTCVLYRTTIDLRQKRATSSRILKPGAKARGECKAISEPEIRMELGSAQTGASDLDEHFVPLLSLLIPVLGWAF